MSYTEALKQAGKRVAYSKVVDGRYDGTLAHVVQWLTESFGVDERRAKSGTMRWAVRYETAFKA